MDRKGEKEVQWAPGPQRCEQKADESVRDWRALSEGEEATRADILGALGRKPEQQPGSQNFWHGRLKHYLPGSGPTVRQEPRTPACCRNFPVACVAL